MRYSQEVYDETALDFPLGEDALAWLPGQVTWVDLHGLSSERDIAIAGEDFGLHPLLVADLGNARQRPKVELEPEQFVLFCRMVRPATEEELADDPGSTWVWEQIGIACGQDGVLTVQERYGDCLDSLRERIRLGRKRVRSMGPGYLAVMIADAIVDAYFPILEWISDQLETLEDDILENSAHTSLARVYATRRDLMHLRRAAWPLREALATLDRQGDSYLSAEVRPYLRDVIDHLIQVVDLTDTYRDLTTTLIDVHLSSVANRTNEVMRLLAVVSTIFIPLSFLAGVYGMNFDRGEPGNMPELGWHFGYVYFWCLCLLIVATLLWLFRRKGWLGGTG